MLTDLRFAFRQLLKSPGFTLLAVITLARGTGLTTGSFRLTVAFFVAVLPVPGPNRIVHVYGEMKERNLTQLPYSVPRFWHYRDGQTVFSGLAADTGNAMTLTALGDPGQ